MSDPQNQVVVLDNQTESSLRMLGQISYALHAIVAVGAVLPGAQGSVLLLVVAFLLDMFKRGDAAGSWQASHFSWRIRSVLWAAVLYGVTIPLFLLFYVPGAIAWAIISIWFLYRIVRGMVAMNNNKAVGG